MICLDIVVVMLLLTVLLLTPTFPMWPYVCVPKVSYNNYTS